MKFFAVFILLMAINTAKCWFFYDSVEMSKDIQCMFLKEIRTDHLSSCASLDDELEGFKNCTNEMDASMETGCSAFTNHFSRCSKPYFEASKLCLPPESQDVPEVLAQSVESLVSHVCTRDGEHLFEYLNGCIHTPTNHSITCERIVKKKLKEYRDSIPTKSDLCEVIETVRVCLTDHLQDSCKSEVVKESALGVFEAIASPCKATTINETE